jgi:energy-coupling factor transport system permease protein
MLTPALLTFNPWLQLLTIGIAALTLPSGGPSPATPDSPTHAGILPPGVLWRLALAALVFGGVFNVLIVREGDLVLARVPDSIPVLGGALTAEAFTYGVLNALRVVSIIFAFAAFSRVIDYADLLRLAPAALFELGLMISIGVTLIPFTLRSYREISQAQALRGHRPQGWRGLVPLITPLIANGMEHALALAESLEARGYGTVRFTRHVMAGQALALFSLFALLLVLTLNTFSRLSPAILGGTLAMAGAMLLASFRLMASGSARTRLRRSHWGAPECWVVAGVGITLTALLIADRHLLVYDPYRMAALGWPPFSPWVGLALLGLSLPALLQPFAPAPR